MPTPTHYYRSLASDSPPSLASQEPYPIPPQTEPWYQAIPQDQAGEAAQPPEFPPQCFTYRRLTRDLRSFESFDVTSKSTSVAADVTSVEADITSAGADVTSVDADITSADADVTSADADMPLAGPKMSKEDSTVYNLEVFL